MAKITISMDKVSKNIKQVSGKLTGIERQIKSMGFIKIDESGEGLVHEKTYQPTKATNYMDVLHICFMKDINTKIEYA